MFLSGGVDSSVTAALLALSVFGIFLVAPEDADQGIIQRIFYFHVAIALTSLVAFLVAAIYGIRYLRSRRPEHDRIGAASVGSPHPVCRSSARSISARRAAIATPSASHSSRNASQKAASRDIEVRWPAIENDRLTGRLAPSDGSLELDALEDWLSDTNCP